MRRSIAGLVVFSALSTELPAQERDRSLEKASIALQQPALAMPALEPPPPAKLGPFTFETPRLRGEFVRLSLPVGEYASRVAREISAANRRRQTSAARRRVEADLKAFREQQRPRQ